MRRTALLRAASELLAVEGAQAVNPGSVGAAAGLARSSVYQYFDSTAGLLQALVEEEMPRAGRRLAAATAASADPRERVAAYVAEAVRLAVDEQHRAWSALAQSALPPKCRERLAELHREQAAPLVEALRDAGCGEPELVAHLIGGVIRGAVEAIGSGADVDAAIGEALALLRGGLVAEP